MRSIETVSGTLSSSITKVFLSTFRILYGLVASCMSFLYVDLTTVSELLFKSVANGGRTTKSSLPTVHVGCLRMDMS